MTGTRDVTEWYHLHRWSHRTKSTVYTIVALLVFLTLGFAHFFLIGIVLNPLVLIFPEEMEVTKVQIDVS